MRIGIVATEGDESALARTAEAHGLFGLVVGTGNPLTAITAAVYASTSTQYLRIVPVVRLGLEHPVTVAEEIAILDNVNNGRTIVAVDTAGLDAEAAEDEISVLREALAGRPLDHDGPRWTVPAGLAANVTAPQSISVTPKPPQAEVPFWVAGRAAAAVGQSLHLPVLARERATTASRLLVQPAIGTIQGELKADRATIGEWAAAGTSHLFLEIPEGDLDRTMTLISRYLSPEAAMPNFPRVMSDSRVPLPWPGENGG